MRSDNQPQNVADTKASRLESAIGVASSAALRCRSTCRWVANGELIEYQQINPLAMNQQAPRVLPSTPRLKMANRGVRISRLSARCRRRFSTQTGGSLTK